MPIRPQHRWLYPIDWPQISASIRFSAAPKVGASGAAARTGASSFTSATAAGGTSKRRSGATAKGKALARLPARAPSPEGEAIRTTKVILAAAHLDHDPGNNRPRNLKALCQRCHMLHDRDEHQRRRVADLATAQCPGRPVSRSVSASVVTLPGRGIGA